MSLKTLDDRRRALEEAFFQKENEKLLADLRTEEEREAQREALSAIMKLSDEHVLDQLIDAGIRAETWLAISLVPLVEVAWADRKMEDEEREAILKAAAKHGVEEGSDARRLLDKWLAKRPPSRVREAWMAYIGAVAKVLGSAALDALREETLEQSRGVAAAAGGFLGLGPRVSKAEESVLEELAGAF